jgi:hypothetical protein
MDFGAWMNRVLIGSAIAVSIFAVSYFFGANVIGSLVRYLTENLLTFGGR